MLKIIIINNNKNTYYKQVLEGAGIGVVVVE